MIISLNVSGGDESLPEDGIAPVLPMEDPVLPPDIPVLPLGLPVLPLAKGLLNEHLEMVRMKKMREIARNYVHGM